MALFRPAQYPDINNISIHSDYDRLHLIVGQNDDNVWFGFGGRRHTEDEEGEQVEQAGLARGGWGGGGGDGVD